MQNLSQLIYFFMLRSFPIKITLFVFLYKESLERLAQQTHDYANEETVENMDIEWRVHCIKLCLSTNFKVV